MTTKNSIELDENKSHNLLKHCTLMKMLNKLNYLLKKSYKIPIFLNIQIKTDSITNHKNN